MSNGNMIQKKTSITDITNENATEKSTYQI